jgi:hydantoinase/carbamoylase family amidase
LADLRLDAGRAIADLRELDRLTGGPEGARRVAWGEEWQAARDFLGRRLAELGIEPERDEAGNLWARLEGREREAVAVGSHLDSVPGGGWLDGALGVMAALELLRTLAAGGDAPARSVVLVDWADEEGVRFGRSLFGSSAAAGTLDPAELRGISAPDGRPAEEVLAAVGVDLERAPEAAGRLEGLAAYLELHIEQGPVLESEGLPAAAVAGTAGVERHRLVFEGQAAHAGTTPMEMRHDAGLAAAETALALEPIARSHGGVATTGRLALTPGIPTAVAGRAELMADLRHPEAGALASMLAEAHEAAVRAAKGRGCSLRRERAWSIEPLAFDPGLVELARRAVVEVGGRPEPLVSGALHDAAEVSRSVPTAMVFCSSTGGLSHTREEDTPEPDLERALEAFGRLAIRVVGGGR